MSMRLFVQTLNFAEGAIGLGVDELRWPNAVRPGDVLTVETEILELRPSRSRPGYGIIRLRNVTTNQRGEVVQTMLASAMVPRRNQSTGNRQPAGTDMYDQASDDEAGIKSGASDVEHNQDRAGKGEALERYMGRIAPNDLRL